MTLVVLSEQGRDEGVDAVYDSPDVDGECPLPVALLVIPDRTLGTGTDAGVVADDVDCPELLRGCVTQIDDGVELGDVSGNSDRVGAFLAQRLDRLIEAFTT